MQPRQCHKRQRRRLRKPRRRAKVISSIGLAAHQEHDAEVGGSLTWSNDEGRRWLPLRQPTTKEMRWKPAHCKVQGSEDTVETTMLNPKTHQRWNYTMATATIGLREDGADPTTRWGKEEIDWGDLKCGGFGTKWRRWRGVSSPEKELATAKCVRGVHRSWSLRWRSWRTSGGKGHARGKMETWWTKESREAVRREFVARWECASRCGVDLTACAWSTVVQRGVQRQRRRLQLCWWSFCRDSHGAVKRGTEAVDEGGWRPLLGGSWAHRSAVAEREDREKAYLQEYASDKRGRLG